VEPLSVRTEIILRQIRRAGYHVTVHRTGDRLELHAVLAIDPRGTVHLSPVFTRFIAPGEPDAQRRGRNERLSIYVAMSRLARRLTVDADGP